MSEISSSLAHNPREDCRGRALDALRSQTLPFGDWELLLIDNGNREPLASGMGLWWHFRGPENCANA